MQNIYNIPSRGMKCNIRQYICTSYKRVCFNSLSCVDSNGVGYNRLLRSITKRCRWSARGSSKIQCMLIIRLWVSPSQVTSTNVCQHLYAIPWVATPSVVTAQATYRHNTVYGEMSTFKEYDKRTNLRVFRCNRLSAYSKLLADNILN